MRRRDFIMLLGGAAMISSRASAGQDTEPTRHITVLQELDETDPDAGRRVAAFEQALEHLGWINGRNVNIKYHWGVGNDDRSRNLISQAVGLAPDVIFTAATSVFKATASATKSIPIIFVLVSDPVGLGFVKSLAHPGGNATGFTAFEPAMGGKWLSLLKDAAPQVSHVRLLFNPATAPIGEVLSQALAIAAPGFGLIFAKAPVHDEAEMEAAIVATAAGAGGGMIVAPDAFTYVRRDKIVAIANGQRLPAIYPFRGFVESGGLISYGVDLLAPFDQAALYVDRILKGANPGDLPVQGPTKFDLVCNLKTAKALGLSLPPLLLAQANELIE
jgi:putative ABC transport system substrate-binding protein